MIEAVPDEHAVKIVEALSLAHVHFHAYPWRRDRGNGIKDTLWTIVIDECEDLSEIALPELKPRRTLSGGKMKLVPLAFILSYAIVNKKKVLVVRLRSDYQNATTEGA